MREARGGNFYPQFFPKLPDLFKCKEKMLGMDERPIAKFNFSYFISLLFTVLSSYFCCTLLC